MSIRMSPPGRTSISHTGLLKPRGPHHRATCLESVQALKTRWRGAPIMRVRVSSCLACPVAELLRASAMLLLLCLNLGQVVVQPVEPLFPCHAVVFHPVGDVLERRGFDTARAPLGGAGAGNKSRLFKDF